MFWSFHPLADKTNNEHLPKPFFKVIRTSLYQTVLNTRPFRRITSSFTCYTVTYLSHFSLLTSLFLEASSNGRILTAILPSSASSKAYDNSTGTVSLENKQTKDTWLCLREKLWKCRLQVGYYLINWIIRLPTEHLGVLKGAVSRQFSSSCLIFPITRSQSL